MKNLFVSLFAVVLFAAVSFGQGNKANTTQNGSSNEAFVEQLGSTNSATILSQGNLNNDNSVVDHLFSVPNTDPLILYPSPMMAKGITQHGDENTGTITQSWNSNHAGIAQYGNGDVANITQSDPTSSSTSYRNAWVDQLNGNGNTANVTQMGPVLSSYVLQNGGLNTVSINQSEFALSDAVQDGSANKLIQTQSSGLSTTDKNEAYSYQIGNNNFAVQTQSAGSSNTSLITSIGNNNGILGDEIKTVQIGSGNSASIEEGLLGAVNSSLASVFQTGSSNIATVSQETGDFNEARVTQNTSSNKAHVYQTGASNYSIITQQ